MTNRVSLYGHLGKDPELRVTPAGKKVTNLSVASTEMKKTVWVDVVVWDKLAENCVNFLHKGSSVLVFGRLIQDSFETKEGRKVTLTKVNANSVKFLDKVDKKEVKEEKPQQKMVVDTSSEFSGDDIPF
jgi:single-strand DNA-binding protein